MFGKIKSSKSESESNTFILYISNIGNKYFKYIAIVPLICILAFMSLYPLLRLFFMSFNEVTISGGEELISWVGLTNYIRTFTNRVFLNSIYRTFIYVIFSVSGEVILAFILAMLVTKVKKGATFYKTIFILPFLIPPVVNATVWDLMYNPQFGLFNIILEFIGLESQSWLSSSKTALPAIIVASIWQWFGYSFILILAGLQSIPQTYIEAARVDGANKLNLIFRVILPLMKPILFITIMFRTIYAFKAFDLFFVLTGGGPGRSTEIINTYIQEIFMAQRRVGFGSSLSIVSIIIISVVAIFFKKGLGVKRGSEY